LGCVIPALERLRQEYQKLEDSLDYIGRICLHKKERHRRKRGEGRELPQ
jgi:hypothetical protein